MMQARAPPPGFSSFFSCRGGSSNKYSKAAATSLIIIGGPTATGADSPPRSPRHAADHNSNSNSDSNSKPMPRAPSFPRLKSRKMRALIKKSSHSHTRRISKGEQQQQYASTNPQQSKAAAHNAFHDDDDDEPSTTTTTTSTTSRRAPLALPGWARVNAGAATKNAPGLGKQHRRKLPADSNSSFFSRKSFQDLGCTDDVVKSLTSQSFLCPSHIQALAYRPVLQGRTCIIADQSGSGKTLAYLAPIVQRLRQEELLGLGKSSSKCPRAVILVPTAELASQVLNSCRSMAKFGVPFRSMVATGGFRQKTQLENLRQEMDVLIATPGRFMFLLEEGSIQLTNLKCVVLDEVDILFGDEGFKQVLQSLIAIAPVATQCLFVTATLPVDVYNKLVELFPDCEVCMGPGVHRTSSRLEEVLVDCSGDDKEEKNPDTAFQNKKSALLQLVEESPVPKTIIFCNKIETCRKVENVMQRIDRKGVRMKVLPFHAALAQEVRLSNIKEFLNPTASREPLFLVCTDRASRGIDFSNVDHVVLFDFPRDPSEYVRRVGRTARGAGSKMGKAFIFVVGKQVSLARRIIERNRKGNPLHEVPCAYELETSLL